MIKFPFNFSLLSIFLLFVFTSVANSQSRSDEIQELKRQIEEIQRQHREQIDQLMKRIEELEAKSATEEKEVEESIVREETDSEEAWYKKFEVGYDKGVVAKTTGGNFKMRMRTLGQFRFSVDQSDNKNTATSFEIRRFRVQWVGNAFRPWFLYFVQIGDDGNGFELIDTFFTAAFKTKYGEVITPRVGQFKVPFTREVLVNAPELQFVDRGILDAEFGGPAKA